MKISEKLVLVVQQVTAETKKAAAEGERPEELLPGILVAIYGMLGAIAIELAKMNERAENAE